MSVLLGNANGFKVKTVEEMGKLRINVEILVDGEKITENSFLCSSLEKKEDIIAEYLASVMYRYDVERDIPEYERKRLAKKAMKLNLVNGYKIIVDGIYTEENARNITIELLKNGEFLALTTMRLVTDENMEKLLEKLNNIVQHNIDIRHQYRPIYLEEILVIVNQ